ncbi:MAG: hypothetical protein FWF11_01300 [Coriobacteriia bacterium]|nr:hypothetical protein [Coriobacteriia bacterium]
MRYDQLEHAIRAACDVADDTELLIFGSQAILGTYPQAPEALRASIEVDIQPKNKPEMTDCIDGTLGDGSLFHLAHGFYVHGISIEAAALPGGWDKRMIVVSHSIGTRGNKGHCLEVHDLAASKLAAYREKDLQFVALLLQEDLVDKDILADRVEHLPIDESKIQMLKRWLEAMDTREACRTP